MTDVMQMPANKAELLAFMQEQWDGFVRASDLLPDEVWLGPVDAAGWNIRDHVAHVATWLTAEYPLLSAGIPIPETMGMPLDLWDSHDTDAINAWYWESFSEMSPAETRAARDRAFPPIAAVVAGFSEEALRGPARISGLEESDRPLLTVMSENYGLHFDDHRAQIEQLARSGGA